MEAKFLAAALSFLSIFLAIYAQSSGPESLVPKYENVEKQMVFYNIRSHLILSCEVKIGNYSDLIWKKNDTLVNDVKTLIGRFRIIKAEGKFVIDKADVIDDGRYSCELNGVSKNITAIAKPIVRVPSNHGVVEGEKLTIPCTAVGSQPRLSWSFGNYTNVTESTGRYILKKDESSNVENSILIIENVTLDDRGDYKCSGHNAAPDDANDTATVRVKGKFAALWPFLGICAEVLILCLIILIYEKRRNKSELEESDTDPQEQKKKRRNYD
ncbi:basigin isoform X3 [Drosophila nasuta]|uniref:basigin isoform X3 n=1 Tax=Drosophila nasuta TaxID=42062 RepID=UPI00295E5A3E|nr:basigin isoform X3 [Drosophila nasuta]